MSFKVLSTLLIIKNDLLNRSHFKETYLVTRNSLILVLINFKMGYIKLNKKCILMLSLGQETPGLDGTFM